MRFFSEGRCCDAIIRIFERRYGAERRNVRVLENEGLQGAVELACSIHGVGYAIEHTGIETFPNQIEMQMKANRLIGPMRDMVHGRLPEREEFELGIRHDDIALVRNRDVEGVQEALANWVIAMAPQLPIAAPGRYELPIEWHQIEGVPFAVRFHRWSTVPQLAGVLMVSLGVDGNREDLREERLRQSCDDKYPKLQRWKDQHGGRSILILEDRDLFLSNQHRVIEALQVAEQERADKADYVFMVGSWMPEQWFAWCLRNGEHYLYDLPEDDRYWEINPADLTDITGRG